MNRQPMFSREVDKIVDGPLVRAEPLDVASLTGDWVSTRARAGDIRALRVVEGNDGVRLSTAAGALPFAGAWADLPATAFASTPRAGEAVALAAAVRPDQGGGTELVTYQGMGVTVVHSLHAGPPESEQPNYFTIQFTVPGNWPESTPETERAEQAFADTIRPGRWDLSGLLGAWQNISSGPVGIDAAEFHQDGGDIVARFHSVGADGAVDWEPRRISLYLDAANLGGPPGLFTTYDHGYMTLRLHGRVNLGVLVLYQYTEFTDDSGRSNYFIRECFQR